jgi:WhiB family redox-sensing transcriptional regulator
LSHWKDAANCKGQFTDMFYETFPTKLERQVRKSLCGTCEVFQECREYAIRHEEFGYWGGLGERERRHIRSQRGIRLRTMSVHES